MSFSFDYCFRCLIRTRHIDEVCQYCLGDHNKERISKWHEQDLHTKLDDLRKRIERLEQEES